jgi:GNAT superfamily N-acetyltransferase
MKTKSIRKALTNEANILTQLAFDSKSYWGYDQKYLEIAREHIKITIKDIEEDHVYVIESEDGILGFYQFRYDDPELLWLFVHPKRIGQGIGKVLWKHLVQYIRDLKVKEFKIKSDPNAELFYIKQGAQRIGFEASTVDKKMNFPLLKYIETGDLRR